MDFKNGDFHHIVLTTIDILTTSLSTWLKTANEQFLGKQIILAKLKQLSCTLKVRKLEIKFQMLEEIDFGKIGNSVKAVKKFSTKN